MIVDSGSNTSGIAFYIFNILLFDPESAVNISDKMARQVKLA